ncbi:glycosyl hydrolase family 28-related protein [Chryseobacterium lineare]
MSKQIQDPQTGEFITLVPVTHWYNGDDMSDTYVDDILYFKGETTDDYDYYIRYIEDHINVKWFGAKGDGSDATASIQHAFNYLIDMCKYRLEPDSYHQLCCLIPDGRYKITSTLLFPKSCTLKGESKHGTVLFTENANISVIFPTEKGTTANDHWHQDSEAPDFVYSNTGEEFTNISDLTIAGPNYGINPSIERGVLNNFSNGIIIQNTDKFILQNLHIEGFENAAIQVNNSYYINIENSTFFNNKIGLLADGVSTTMEVSHSVFRLNSVGLSFSSSYGCSITNTIIESNIANYLRLLDINRSPYISSGIGVLMNNCKSISFDGCYIENHIVGVVLDNSHSNVFCNSFLSPSSNNANTYVTWFYGSNSSYNKFANNHYLSSNTSLYPAFTFFVFQKDSSKGNVFELTMKDHLDSFISQNAAEFTEFRTLGLTQNAPKFTCTGANEQFIDAERRFIIDKTFGSTSERPTVNLYKGQHYFDSTLGKPIFWQGVKWVKADGTDA